MSYQECDRHGTDVTNDRCRLCEPEIQSRSRAVLPDEIDEGPVEPAPDEGLVERIADIIASGIGSLQSRESIARAVLAEIERDKFPPLGDRERHALWDEVTRHEERVAELEAELKRERRQHDEDEGVSRERRSFILRLESDLATVTRERDELAEVKRDDHLACERIAADYSDLVATHEAIVGELAEAREELRQVTKPSGPRPQFNADGLTRTAEFRWGQGFQAAETWLAAELGELRLLRELEAASRGGDKMLLIARQNKLDAHRAKTPPSSLDSDKPPVSAGSTVGATPESAADGERITELIDDLATVTRERDELKARHGTDCVSAFARIDSLTRELAEAKQELSWSRAEYQAAQRVAGDALDELAEAREELRLLGRLEWFVRSQHSGTYRCSLAALDAHRAKTSGVAGSVDAAHGDTAVAAPTGSAVENSTQPAAPELPYETAPRLTKGVRYRVVEQVQPGSGFRVGDEHSATGDEEHVVGRGDGGWYLLSRSHIHRVVRVEPEKTQSKCPQCSELDGAHKLDCSFREPSQWKFGAKSDDGGGERPGQPAFDHEGSELDSGPPRVGDVVRVDKFAPYSWVLKTVRDDIPRVGDTFTVAEWSDDEEWPQLTASGVAWRDPSGSPSFAGKFTLIRRAGQPETKAEAPLLGPHAGTVADLVRRVERLEDWHVDPQREHVDRAHIEEEIRAERAGRKGE